jgi:hypothetical protein
MTESKHVLAQCRLDRRQRLTVSLGRKRQFPRTAAVGRACLADVAGVFEFEVNAAGKTQTKMWEWK